MSLLSPGLPLGRRAPRAALLLPESPRTTADAGDRRRTRLTLAGALALALVLRLPYVGMPLGVDEGGIAYIARAWGTGHGSLYGAYWIDRPPLLVALFKLAVLGGDVGIRALGATAALALVTLTFLLTRAVAGDRAARIAALLAAAFSGSVALTAVFTPGELLAAVPSAASVLCLLAAHRGRGMRWLVLAGTLAVTAALIKQSFLDAGFAGAVFIAATWARDRRLTIRPAAAYLAGALVPVVGALTWQTVVGLPATALPYALFGFRVDALRTLSGSSLPLHVRVLSLLVPGAASGLFVALAAALVGLRRLRGDGVLMLTIAAWLGAGIVGVLGGGSYWPHYLIAVIAPAAMLTAIAVCAARPRVRRATVAIIAAIAVSVTVGAAVITRVDPPLHDDVVVADYVRAHARPGDTQYVMYARANVGYYTGLPSPFPYAWSMMMRAIPGATARLTGLLESARRPTWVVAWQDDDSWHLDAQETMDRVLRDKYRRVATVRGHAIYHRVDPTPSPLAIAEGPHR